MVDGPALTGQFRAGCFFPARQGCDEQQSTRDCHHLTPALGNLCESEEDHLMAKDRSTKIVCQ
jgi:hypothetical protein